MGLGNTGSVGEALTETAIEKSSATMRGKNTAVENANIETIGRPIGESLKDI